MKLYLLFGTALAVFVCMVTADSHNVNFGVRIPTDIMAHQATLRKDGKFLRVQEVNHSFNLEHIDNPKIITLVEVLDQYTNNKGGHCSLVSGGPGQSFVNLNCKSQRSQGLHFIVRVYAV